MVWWEEELFVKRIYIDEEFIALEMDKATKFFIIFYMEFYLNY